MQNLTVYNSDTGQYILKEGAGKTEALNRLGMLEHIAEEKFRTETRETLSDMFSCVINKESSDEISGLLLRTVLDSLGDYDIEKPNTAILKTVLSSVIKEAVSMWLENASLGSINLTLKEIYSHTDILVSKYGNGFIDISDSEKPVSLIPGKSILKIVNTSHLSKNEEYRWYFWNENSEKYEENPAFRGLKEYVTAIPDNSKHLNLRINGNSTTQSGWARYITIM